MIKKLNSYLIITQFEDLSLKDFRKHILYLYNNNILYDFNLGCIYNIHVFDENGTILNTYFSLSTLETKNEETLENTLEYYYSSISINIYKYLLHNNENSKSNNLCIYISKDKQDVVNLYEYSKLLENTIYDLSKIHNDLLLPIISIVPDDDDS